MPIRVRWPRGGRGMVFRISLFVVVALALVAGLAPQSFEVVSKGVRAAVMQNAVWLYLLIVFLALVFLICLAFGATGRLWIGGIGAEPEFSTATWLAMLF